MDDRKLLFVGAASKMGRDTIARMILGQFPDADLKPSHIWFPAATVTAWIGWTMETKSKQSGPATV